MKHETGGTLARAHLDSRLEFEVGRDTRRRASRLAPPADISLEQDQERAKPRGRIPAIVATQGLMLVDANRLVPRLGGMLGCASRGSCVATAPLSAADLDDVFAGLGEHCGQARGKAPGAF
jgi:hypothetical protein